MEQDEKLKTIREAAQRLGVHQHTIRSYVSDGRLSAVRIGERLLRIKSSDLERLIRPVQRKEKS